MKALKRILWKIGIINYCPECEGQLKQVGFVDEFTGEAQYECYKESCVFNKI